MENEKARKLRGGYYTPQAITDFISKWAIRRHNDTILEPSCGDGAFIESIISRYLSLGVDKAKIPTLIHAVEYDQNEAEKARNLFKKHCNKDASNQVVVGDFFNFCRYNLTDKVQFDCIVGNPPFIRYQNFPNEQRLSAFSLMIRAGLKPNKLTNTWIPFLIASTLLLKNRGRIGMVIPAELFQVNYAAETRRFLSEYYSSLFIVTFRKLVFPDVQQEVVILLGEKNGSDKHGINVIELDDISDLHTIKIAKLNNNFKIINHSSDKWTQYFLDSVEIDLLRRITLNPAISLSGEVMNVDVGVVTGQNNFFVLTKDNIHEYELDKYAIKMVGKAKQIKGLIISDKDWQILAKSQFPVYLLNLPDVDYNSLPTTIRKYVDYGASQGFDSGYKCRIRKRWWVLPSAWTPDAFMLRQVHAFPKIVLNRCNATATDTLHRVKLINGMKGEALASAFVNSLTLAFSEVTGRSYGGGVLTFEPSEAEKLPLPLRNANKLDIREIDHNIRENNIEAALNHTDDILLRKGLGLPEADIAMLRGIWQKLRDRRIQRKIIAPHRVGAGSSFSHLSFGQ